MKAPNGKRIVGTQEILLGVANIENARIENSAIAFDWEGSTDCDWDSQVVIRLNGQRIFVDESGKLWREDELVAFATTGKKAKPVSIDNPTLDLFAESVRHEEESRDVSHE